MGDWFLMVKSTRELALVMVPIEPVEHCMFHGTTGGSTNSPNPTKLGVEAIAGSWPEVLASTWITTQTASRSWSSNLARWPAGPVQASGETSIVSMRVGKY